ncbi:MAG TPA: hypothetical protein VMT35_15095 [Ignavibacteriaceae bacterium]|nr:hypothetical protein [Ignavibacteriaceae bacterium]
MNIEFDKNETGISLKEFDKKLYIDPQFGVEKYSSTLNYAVFTSCWNIEDVKEDYSIKIVHPESGDSILLSFNSFKDKLAFAQSIYSSQQIKQIGKGHDLESLANLNILHTGQNSHEQNTLITAFEILRSIADKHLLPKLNIDIFFKRIRSIFKKGQFASWL